MKDSKDKPTLSKLDHLELEIKEEILEKNKLSKQLNYKKEKIASLKQEAISTLTKEITKDQIGLMNHTVEYKTRNWCGVGYGTIQEAAFIDLEKKGLARRLVCTDWILDEMLFCLTDKGIELIDRLRRLEGIR